MVAVAKEQGEGRWFFLFYLYIHRLGRFVVVQNFEFQYNFGVFQNNEYFVGMIFGGIFGRWLLCFWGHFQGQGTEWKYIWEYGRLSSIFFFFWGGGGGG